ncbi:MAG: MBL fold metallo-hydrolase, partial [Calditrichaeota bacterium]|nr:MBL fold metallo-hydrolase [Calditrichota bacterium]
MTILGSGTSMGVPMAGCDCQVCRSEDPKDQRLRPSVLVRIGEAQILIDTSLDYRQQMLRAGVRRLDAVLYTH